MALDHDGKGVDQLEFVVGMLQILGVELCGEPLRWGDVRPFIILFDRLDESKNRKLSQVELEAYVSLTELAMLERSQSKASLARSKGSLDQGDRASGITWVPEASPLPQSHEKTKTARCASLPKKTSHVAV